jgi:hypothetical protein
MNSQRPAVVTSAAILLIILTLFIAGLGIARQYGLLSVGLGNRQFVPGQFQGRNFNPQDGFPQGGFPNDQNNQGTMPNFTPNRQGGLGLVRIFRLIRPVLTGSNVILVVLGVIAAIGLFKSKRWGAILAILLAVLLFLLAIPGLFRIFSISLLIENLIRMLLAVAVIFLLLLPSARKSFLPAPESTE